MKPGDCTGYWSSPLAYVWPPPGIRAWLLRLNASELEKFIMVYRAYTSELLSLQVDRESSPCTVWVAHVKVAIMLVIVFSSGGGDSRETLAFDIAIWSK